MTQPPIPQARPFEPPPASAILLHNRVAAVLMHVPWYSIVGPARLARDAGVDKSTVSRLLAGRTTPSYRVVTAITAAIARRAGGQIIADELFSTDGSFPTERVCSLMSCPGCLPGTVYDRQTDIVHPEFRTLCPGTWALSVQTGGTATVTSHGDRTPKRGHMT